MRIGTPGEKSHRKVEGVGGEESIFLVSKCFRKHFPFFTLRFFLSFDRIRIPRIETIIRGRKYVESVVVVRRTGLYRFRYGCLYYDRFAWRVAKLRVLDRQEGRGRRGGGDYLVDLVRLGSRGFPQGWKWVAIVSDHLGRRRRRKFFGGCHLEKKNFTRNRKKRTSERREKKG